ncbi:carbon-nitrogen hydrolase [Lipomyces japonicus]|uniref:carbon-nitrogen hydrolase n=1 Tax=Lipomyces japonicus TaxID=56871 RepID=UPI0034CEC538
MRFLLLSALAGIASASVLPWTPADPTTVDYNNLTVALVRAEPANWPLPVMNKNWTGVHFDINATVSKAVTLIEEAAENGANLVVFPELWFPGYPKGLADNVSIAPYIQDYVDNSLEVGTPQWETLINAAKDNGVYLVPAFSHRDGNSIYMAQALISPEGEVLLLRHKLRPSGGERTIWSDGDIDELKVIATPYGRWGLLECWEHFHPAMTYNIQSQAETLHIASWPYTPNPADASAAYWESAEVNVAAARLFAVNTGAPLVYATVGNARFLDSQGLDITVVNASVPLDSVPLVYTSFNTTGLANTVPYTIDGEQSYGILQQINAGFPSFIPQVVGTFVQKNIVLLSDLLN